MDKSTRPSIFRRLVALFIDMMLLFLIGYLSAFFLEDFYVSLGKYGTLVGSVVAVTYFSVFQGPLGKGQTIGKMLLSIKVTDVNGQYLSWGKSLLRSSIFILPIMNIEILAGGRAMVLFVMAVILTVFTSLYLMLANKSRRSLHDILTSSVVTLEEIREFQVNEVNDRSNKKLIPAGVVAAALFGFGIYQMFAENDLGKLLDVKDRIENLPGVIVVSEVKLGTRTSVSTNSPSETYTFLQVTVRTVEDIKDSNINSRYFDDFYKIIREEVPEANNIDKVSLSLYHGYNIGIASKNYTVTKTFGN